MEETDIKGGRYTLLRRLGEGSQGETFEARDNGPVEPLVDQWRKYVEREGGKRTTRRPSTPGRHVAIKRFRVAQAKAWKDVELAEREATTLASLEHAKLPRYIEHFEEEGALYLVMEKVEGESLAAIRSRGASLPAADVLRMLEDMADALRYLHGRAPVVVHRDIKPGNVIRRADGSFALVDFGAVRHRLKPSGGSTVVGTFGYMAPEQFQGRASPQSDVYGVGATAITLLTGCEPEALPHVGLGIDVARAVPKRTPKRLVRALERMLEPDPDRRAESIDDALGDERKKRTKKTRRRRPEKPAKGEKKRARAARGAGPSPLGRGLAWIAASVVLVALVAIFVVAFGSAWPLLFFAALPLLARWVRREERSLPARVGEEETPRVRVATAVEEDLEADDDEEALEEARKRER